MSQLLKNEIELMKEALRKNNKNVNEFCLYVSSKMAENYNLTVGYNEPLGCMVKIEDAI